MVAAAVARAFWWFTLKNSNRAYLGTDCRADGLLIGSLLALILCREHLPRQSATVRLTNIADPVALVL